VRSSGIIEAKEMPSRRCEGPHDADAVLCPSRPKGALVEATEGDEEEMTLT